MHLVKSEDCHQTKLLNILISHIQFFLEVARDTPDSDNDIMCTELKKDEGWKKSTGINNSRPVSIASEPERNDNRWIDIVSGNENADDFFACSQKLNFFITKIIISVPLMMAYVTRYIYGTDKLRTNAFEVRGLNGVSSGIIHCDDLAILSQWLKFITDNIVGLTQLQVKFSTAQQT